MNQGAAPGSVPGLCSLLPWSGHVQGNKRHTRTHKRAHTHTQRAGLQPKRQPRGQPEWRFYGWAYLLLRGTGFHTENAKSMTDVTQHTHTYAHTCTHAQHFIYFQGREGIQGLLLESTEAFYRTALRRGHCATQAHSGRSSLTPPYTPMGDNGKGGYILPRRRRERKQGLGEKEQEKWKDRGSLSFIRPSVHPLLHFA